MSRVTGWRVAQALGLKSTHGSCTGGMLSQSVGGDNRITGLPYDAAGNQLGNGVDTYQWDAESRMKTVNNGATATYTYDANGMRERKQTGSEDTSYVYFGGQVIAERNAVNGDWSDYIYAGGRRLAKADNFEDRLRMWATKCGTCGWDVADSYISASAVIRAGDKLHWLQWASGSARGGIVLRFPTGGSYDYAYYNAWDQDGQAINDDAYNNQWHYRRVDLSAFAGKTLDTVLLRIEGSSPTGYNEIYFRDIALVSADGKVQGIYNRQKTFPMSMAGTAGMSGLGNEVNTWRATTMAWPQSTTFYYHGDHLGSSRMMTTHFAFPTWEATYRPYGEEHLPAGAGNATTNHYKFTGKERDAESSLDYFGARYYASTSGRFLSADEFVGGPVDVFGPGDPAPPNGLPYANVLNPQSLNKYTYVFNRPLRFVDPTGHSPNDWVTFKESIKKILIFSGKVGYGLEGKTRIGSVKLKAGISANAEVDLTSGKTKLVGEAGITARKGNVEIGPGVRVEPSEDGHGAKVSGGIGARVVGSGEPERQVGAQAKIGEGKTDFEVAGGAKLAVVDFEVGVNLTALKDTVVSGTSLAVAAGSNLLNSMRARAMAFQPENGSPKEPERKID